MNTANAEDYVFSQSELQLLYKEQYLRACAIVNDFKKCLDTNNALNPNISIDINQDGWVDIDLTHNDYELLICVPSNDYELAGYYGDNKKNNSVKGNMEIGCLTGAVIHSLLTVIQAKSKNKL